ncbi:uncharacterized protein LOC143919980 [Arctopsyche grandis]|uniref:uncharacterized protein LOC143919980 n=1 Tax=Arctopsyche grandis TaxID=121162 RepID=UPI00406D8EE1
MECRLCLSPISAEFPVHIFNKPNSNSVELQDRISRCCLLQMTKHNELPDSICSPCDVNLRLLTNFKQICKLSDEKARHRSIQNPDFKTEEVLLEDLIWEDDIEDPNIGKINTIETLSKQGGVRPFKCGICSKSFTNNNEFTIHMKYHTGKRPFKYNVQIIERPSILPLLSDEIISNVNDKNIYDESMRPFPSDGDTIYNTAYYSSNQNSENVVKVPKRRPANQTQCNTRVIRQENRKAGKTYLNCRGQPVSAKEPKRVDCSKCRFRCSDNFSIEDQNMLCNEYWSLADPARQKSYICSIVKMKPVERFRQRGQETLKPRSISKYYYLPDQLGEHKRVCLKFICATFGISFQVIDLSLKNKVNSNCYTGRDRGKGKQPHNDSFLK